MIALNTYREAVRARLLHGLFGLALATGVYAFIVGAFALNNSMRVTSDLGAASISLYGIVVAIVMAATTLQRELEHKTIFPVLARPVHRTEYLAGKYLGSVLTLIAFVAGNAAALLFALSQFAGRSWVLVVGVGFGSIAVAGGVALAFRRLRTYVPIPWAILVLAIGWQLAANAPDERRVVLGSAVLTIFEVSIVVGLATVFASFSSPFLSAVFTLGVFVVGRSADTLARLPEKVFGRFIHDGGVILSQVFPNLMLYVPPRPLLTGEAADVPLVPYFIDAGLHALVWSAALVTLASLLFRRRDFL